MAANEIETSGMPVAASTLTIFLQLTAIKAGQQSRKPVLNPVAVTAATAAALSSSFQRIGRYDEGGSAIIMKLPTTLDQVKPPRLFKHNIGLEEDCL